MTATLLQFDPSIACPRVKLAGEDFDPTAPHIVVQCKSQRCLHCGTTSRWSEVYEVTTRGKSRSYRPCRVPGDIPVDYDVIAVDIPQEPTLICHECIGQRTTDIEARRRWEETLKRKNEEARASATSAGNETKTSRIVVTDDML